MSIIRHHCGCVSAWSWEPFRGAIAHISARRADAASRADLMTVTFGERDAELVLPLVRWLGPGAELLSPTPWRDTLRAQLESMLRQLNSD